MKNFAVQDTFTKKRSDQLLTLSVLFLTGLGLVTLYSASYAFAQRYFSDSFYFIRNQVIYAIFGLVLFFVFSRLNIEIIRKFIMPLVVVTMILCVLPLVPGVGVTRNGASRWIGIGSHTYQPSELAKLVLPIYLAHIFDKKKEHIDNLLSGILPQLIVTSIFFSLVYLQNNFSTAFFLAMNALVVFFLSGVKKRYFISAAVILFPLSFLLILTKEHRLQRFISFIWPDWEPLGAGYQVRSAVLSIQSGGFWGKGIGLGTRKIASVPEIHSDFVFSAYAEESGFLGVTLFVLLLAFFAYRAYRVAINTDNMFKKLLVFSLTTTITAQALTNLAVISGLLPATGIPLPFFSAGGSSLATTLLICGIIVNVSAEERSGANVN